MLKKGNIFKIFESDPKRYQMFSDAGNNLCEKLSKGICERIIAGELTIEVVVSEIKKGMEKIAEMHPEVNDSEPRAQFRYEIQEAFREVGVQVKDFWI